jgi:hypothetical protein
MRLLKICIVICCIWLPASVWAQSDLETSVRSIGYNVNELPEFPEAAYGSLLGILAPGANGLYLHEPLDLVIVTRENHAERTIIMEFYRLSTLLRSSPSDRTPVQSFPISIGDVLTKAGMSTRVDISFHPTQPVIYMRLRAVHVSRERVDLFREHYKQPFIIFSWRNNQANMVFRSDFPKDVNANDGGAMFVPHRGDRMFIANTSLVTTKPNRNKENREPVLAWIPLRPDGLPAAPADKLEFEGVVDISMINSWNFLFGRQILEVDRDVYLVSSVMGPFLYNPGFRRSPISTAGGGQRRQESALAYNRKYPSIYFSDIGSQRFGRFGFFNGAFTDIMQEGWTGGPHISGTPAVMSRYNILAMPSTSGILAVVLDEIGRITPRAYVYRVSTGGVTNVVYHEASGKLIYTTNHKAGMR